MAGLRRLVKRREVDGNLDACDQRRLLVLAQQLPRRTRPVNLFGTQQRNIGQLLASHLRAAGSRAPSQQHCDPAGAHLAAGDHRRLLSLSTTHPEPTIDHGNSAQSGGGGAEVVGRRVGHQRRPRPLGRHRRVVAVGPAQHGGQPGDEGQVYSVPARTSRQLRVSCRESAPMTSVAPDVPVEHLDGRAVAAEWMSLSCGSALLVLLCRRPSGDRELEAVGKYSSCAFPVVIPVGAVPFLAGRPVGRAAQGSACPRITSCISAATSAVRNRAEYSCRSAAATPADR